MTKNQSQKQTLKRYQKNLCFKMDPEHELLKKMIADRDKVLQEMGKELGKLQSIVGNLPCQRASTCVNRS